MNSAVVYLTLAAILALTEGSWWIRSFFTGIALSLTLLVGVTRVYLGVHWPTDVATG